MDRTEAPPTFFSALPLKKNDIHSTSIDFANNQLSTGLISLSLQTIPHPNLMQQTRVRASNNKSIILTLEMVRSPVFGS